MRHGFEEFDLTFAEVAEAAEAEEPVDTQGERQRHGVPGMRQRVFAHGVEGRRGLAVEDQGDDLGVTPFAFRKVHGEVAAQRRVVPRPRVVAAAGQGPGLGAMPQCELGIELKRRVDQLAAARLQGEHPVDGVVVEFGGARRLRRDRLPEAILVHGG